MSPIHLFQLILSLLAVALVLPIATRRLPVPPAAALFPGIYLARLLFASLRTREPAPPPSIVLIIGWAGMRGVVSLAAALALPQNFPGRDLLLFATFAVIAATVLGIAALSRIGAGYRGIGKSSPRATDRTLSVPSAGNGRNRRGRRCVGNARVSFRRSSRGGGGGAQGADSLASVR